MTMKKTISIRNAEHYSWGENCDGWHLLKTDSLSVIQEKMPPGTAEQLHFHTHAQQLFYILSGTATFEVEEQVTVVKAHESIHVPKGTKHFISNTGDTDLVFLVISEPRSHGDRQNL
jgi:mannose-6-phosphate isomerase-like protein (cupin superfamily)